MFEFMLTPELSDMLSGIRTVGGRPMLVGGSVRDAVMSQEYGLPFEPKDLDIEVFGISWQQMVDMLNIFGRVSEVGKSFGVVKVRDAHGREVDFSLPRMDSKNGIGHKGFQVTVDPNMTP